MSAEGPDPSVMDIGGSPDPDDRKTLEELTMLHPELARRLAEAHIRDLHRAADEDRLARAVQAGRAPGSVPSARPLRRVALSRLRLLSARLLTSLR